MPVAAPSAWANYRAGASSGSGGPNPWPDDFSTSRFPENGYNRRREPRRPFSEMNLQEVNDWENIDFCKDFNKVPHPDISDLDEREVNLIRLKHGLELLHLKEGQTWTRQVPTPTAEDLALIPFERKIQEELRSRGFKEPKPIQVQGWPSITSGHNVVGIAPTGSGKTLTYVLPMIKHCQAQTGALPGQGPIALILVPNRELCKQVLGEINYWKDRRCSNLTAIDIAGGTDERRTRSDLTGKVDIAVATPGRLLEHLRNQDTNLKRTTYVVIDEADHMLASQDGGAHQVQLILGQVRPNKQLVLFTATWEDVPVDFVSAQCKFWYTINVGGMKLSACQDVTQKFWCPGQHRVVDGQRHIDWPMELSKTQAVAKALQEILHRDPDPWMAKVLIFVNSKDNVTKVVKDLEELGITNIAGYARQDGNFGRDQNEENEKQFRDADPESGGKLRVLVSTDVLARGFDFPNCRYVLNFDMPHRRTNMSDYVHRVGRTGRGGRKGFAVTFLEEADLRFAPELCEVLKASKQQPPQWLQNVTTKAAKRYKEQYFRQRERNQLAEMEPQPAGTSTSLSSDRQVCTSSPGQLAACGLRGDTKAKIKEYERQVRELGFPDIVIPKVR
eukprot:TRINITY_DN6062_c0_g1_i1.p1 TRINITY_DN6062_c0_g1~~TRINITY_DN6062_c0_g1_i1.p1  ORF type:complete len:631 (+),score=122.37 TRINITY_DN6062_c0_g1_i1:46-1893(+)